MILFIRATILKTLPQNEIRIAGKTLKSERR